MARAPSAVDGRPLLRIVENVEGDAPPRVRKDMLPEGTDYEDTGCELAKSCLQCPFSRCKDDGPGGGRTLGARERDREMAILREKHRVPVTLLAYTYGVTKRSVYRALLTHGGGREKKRTRRRAPLGATAQQLALPLDIGPMHGAPRASIATRGNAVIDKISKAGARRHA